MGIFSKLEGRVEDAFEGAADKMAGTSLSPVQIAKKAEKQMRREKMVGAGKQYAPTLYTVLVSADDDERLFGYYPTLAGETETYLAAKAVEHGLVMDGQPLVRFIADDTLKRGKFDVVAEAVAAPIVAQLRQEEMERYGFDSGYDYGAAPDAAYQNGYDDYRDYANYDDCNDAYGEYDGYENYDEYAPENQGFDGRRQGSPVPQAPIPQTVVLDGLPPYGDRPVPTPYEAPIMTLFDTSNNRTYKLKSARVQLGREITNNIVINDINVSRVHAELSSDEYGQWRLTDLGSTNGTFVNDCEITACQLYEGDRITVGMTTLVFDRA